MEWKSPFVIYRVSGDGKIEEVYHAADIKKAKYWLTYIAKPGDVLCKTPIHPKHTKASAKPEYWSHKEASGKILAEEATCTILSNLASALPEEQKDFSADNPE